MTNTQNSTASGCHQVFAPPISPPHGPSRCLHALNPLIKNKKTCKPHHHSQCATLVFTVPTLHMACPTWPPHSASLCSQLMQAPQQPCYSLCVSAHASPSTALLLPVCVSSCKPLNSPATACVCQLMQAPQQPCYSLCVSAYASPSTALLQPVCVSLCKPRHGPPPHRRHRP